jgi:3-dehydroquinate dehydratase-2
MAKSTAGWATPGFKQAIKTRLRARNVADLDRTPTFEQTGALSDRARCMGKLLVLHGPNLNLLGRREPAVYGHDTLAAIDARLVARGRDAGIDVECLQSNAEHVLVERVQAAMDDGTGMMLLNPAAFTHTSVALRDAVAAAGVPFIEVHLSNPHAREPFRHHSHFSDLAVGVVAGFGAQGYLLALEAAIARLAGASPSGPAHAPATT